MKELKHNLKESRLSTILDYTNQGYTHKLQVSEATVSKDIQEPNRRAKASISKAIEEEIPNQWYKTRHTLKKISRYLNDILTNEQTNNKGIDYEPIPTKGYHYNRI